MTTKHATYTAKLKASGWKRQDVWLSPDDLERLEAVMRASGASAQAVLRRGLREMSIELPPEPWNGWTCDNAPAGGSAP